MGLEDRASHRPDAAFRWGAAAVAIARSRIFNPPVLFADEPTGNLDSVSGTRLLQQLRGLVNEGQTSVVMVTHEPEAAVHCDHIFVLRDGQFSEDFPVEDIDAAGVATRVQARARVGRGTALLLGTVVIATTLSVMVACGGKSAEGAVSSRLSSSIGKATARVVHPGGGRIERSVLETVRSWPGVEIAVGRMDGSLTLERADGAKDPETNPNAAWSWPRKASRFPPSTTSGRFGSPKVFCRRGQAKSCSTNSRRRSDAKIGTELLIRRFGKPIPLKVTGIWDRPIVGPLQNPTAFVEIGVLGEAINRRDGLGTIAIVHEEGVDVPAFVEVRAPKFPSSFPSKRLTW